MSLTSVFCCLLAGLAVVQGSVVREALLKAGEASFFENPCAVVQSDHFRLVHDMQHAEAEELLTALEFAYGQYESYFRGYGFAFSEPQESLDWMCFNDVNSFREYARINDRIDIPWLTGYYSSRTNRVAVIRPGQAGDWQNQREHNARVAAGRTPEASVDVGLVKVMHESVHQFTFNTGLLKRGVMYPLWVAEGSAMLFEDCASFYLSGRRYSRARRKQLLELHARDDLIDLEQLVVLSGLPRGVSEADVYAQAWGFFVFLCENRTEELIDYLSYLYSVRTGRRTSYRLRREFIESFGSIDKLEQEWIKFLSSPLRQAERTYAKHPPTVDESGD